MEIFHGVKTRIKQLLIAATILPLSQAFALWYESENGYIDDGYTGYAATEIDEYQAMASCEAMYGFSYPYTNYSWFAYEVDMWHNVNGNEGWSGQIYGANALATTYGAKSCLAYSSLGCFVNDIYGYVSAEALQ